MKKVLSIALVAAVFGLVGCSAQDNPEKTAERDYNVAGAQHRPKCVGKKCVKGKLGDEQTQKDTVK